MSAPWKTKVLCRKYERLVYEARIQGKTEQGDRKDRGYWGREKLRREV